MHHKDVLSGAEWRDRYGFAFGKGMKPKRGNVERYLRYGKLHRTGRLLRSMGVGRKTMRNGWQIVLFNTADYAEEHNEGSKASNNWKTTIKPPYVQGGADGVRVGGAIYKRRFMGFREDTKRMVFILMGQRMRRFGW